ncbi:hypothetical protein EGT36_08615 [Agrobacterium sp. FDAARGOS_525]|uniref:hypothetical protein n=1 Tax=Agrobacterium sp. FDAARGOS_525 TaxID=2420311 RepID=UPI000F66859B|nr:hypothetical protein [Agrobacterium sp. FDAARGOS_525]RSC37315.1 hypothetical protein EGT36_08615 [Agrobacterium sp. FDAARGOS_525]
MPKVKNNIAVQFTSTLTLTETEMRALDAIVGYGFDSFIKVFKRDLGENYIQSHEDGARALFATIKREVHPALNEVAEIRKRLLDIADKPEGA